MYYTGLTENLSSARCQDWTDLCRFMRSVPSTRWVNEQKEDLHSLRVSSSQARNLH